MDKPIVKHLPVLARDNYGHSYDVALQLSDGPVGTFGPGLEHLAERYKNRWILRIHGTPGSWYMSTLLADGAARGRIALDFGAGWYVENFGDVMAAAIAAL